MLDSSFNPEPSKIETQSASCTVANNVKLRKRTEDDSDEYVTSDNYVDDFPEQKFISQPKNPFRKVSDTIDYVYDSRAGEGITIYTIDTGLYMAHDEFEHLDNPPIRWLLLPGQTKTDEDGHGTAVMSKICGLHLGIAKWSSNVVLKHQYGPDGHITLASIMMNLQAVATDVYTQNLPGKAVLNLSWGLPPPQPPMFVSNLKAALKHLSEVYHVVIVGAAGNGKVRYPFQI